MTDGIEPRDEPDGGGEPGTSGGASAAGGEQVDRTGAPPDPVRPGSSPTTHGTADRDSTPDGSTENDSTPDGPTGNDSAPAGPAGTGTPGTGTPGTGTPRADSTDTGPASATPASAAPASAGPAGRDSAADEPTPGTAPDREPADAGPTGAEPDGGGVTLSKPTGGGPVDTASAAGERSGATRSGPHRPKSPGGLNSVGMNSGSGHARSNLPGKRSRTTGDTGWDLCNWLSCEMSLCDCNTLLRLSVLLRLAAALAPPAGSGRAVLAVLRFYRRRLTRFTPTCPSTPSCSAYAEAAVRRLGPRRGLIEAAARVRSCGRSPDPSDALTDR